MDQQKSRLTSASGAPIADDNNSVSAGKRGPLTFDNWYLFEKLAHFNRERIPERVVHARGTGAYGYFQLEQSLSEYSIANFLQADKVGKKTDVFIRFSTVGGGQDSNDFARDPRGFAVKFYTDEGNWDMVGNNTPVFFIRDAQKFPDFVHSQKKNPRTNLPDPAGMYEFWANHPQSLHQVTILMSDRGIPASYRNMNGYASHTLSFWNKNGERFWVKWHFKTDQGIKTLSNEEAEKQSSHGNQEDLVNAIDRGEFPSWTVKVQLMPEADASTYKVNPFDLTKVWSHTDYPLLTIGKLVLDKNVQNYFAETEQATFTPGNLVPGIGASPDKVLQARLLSYGDAHRYRVGANHNQLPVNAPRCPVHHYQRDGAMAGTCPVQGMQGNQGSEVNFYPNDRINAGAPSPDPSIAEPPLQLDDATVDRFDTMPEDNFSQAGDLFRLMSESQKDQLARNIAGGLVQAHLDIQTRMLAQFEQADPDYRARVEDLL